MKYIKYHQLDISRKEELKNVIYNLREQRLSYSNIAIEIKKKGIDISTGTVENVCKAIYESKGKKEPNAKRIQRNRKDSLNERIYRLCEQGLDYAEITEKLERQGYRITSETVGRKCRAIYASKGKIDVISNEYIGEENLELNKKIDELKGQGLSYKKVAERLEEYGIAISRQRAEARHKKFLKLSEQELAKAILNLTITRKATIEQIQQIADYYGVDLERTMNSLEEPNHSLDER